MILNILIKETIVISGKSKSLENPFGVRRKRLGEELAPRSLRLKGKIYLSQCSAKELKNAGVGE